MFALHPLARLAAVVLLLTALVSVASAQVPPDVVYLRDGTMFRGTLVERGSERVVLMLPTGEVREFTGSEVERVDSAPLRVEEAPVPVAPVARTVGPEADEPLDGSVAALPVVIVTPTVRLHVHGTEPGRTLHRLTASAEVPLRDRVHRPRIDAMEPLCAAPCAIDLPVGTYVFGVSEGEGNAHRAGAPVHLEEGERWMQISHADRTGTRIAGWVVIGLGAAGGAAIAGFGMESGPDRGGLGAGGAWLGWDAGVWFGIGIGTAAVFALIGALLAITDDEASFSFDVGPPRAPEVVVDEVEEEVDEEDDAVEAPAPARRRQTVPDAF